MLGQVYLLVITVLLLAALAVSVPVLVDIVHEGRERHRRSRAGESESTEADTKPTPGAAREDVPPGKVACPCCGATNEPGFGFCRQCIAPL